MFSFLYFYFLGMEKFLIILSQIPRNLFLTYLVFKLDILHRCGSFSPDLKSCHSNDVTYLLRVSVECFNFLLPVNPLHPNIGIHILHSVLYTLPKLGVKGLRDEKREEYYEHKTFLGKREYIKGAQNVQVCHQG